MPAAQPRAELWDWKRDELIKLGFSHDQATVLLEVPSLSVAEVREKFLSKGCTIEQAYRILAP